MSPDALNSLFSLCIGFALAGALASGYQALVRRPAGFGLLQQGVAQCAKKFGEESVETVIAAMAGDKTRLAAESADALYHLLVLWAAAGITPDDVYAVLKAREAESGLAEKAKRPK